MILVGDQKEMIVLIRMKGQRWYRLACFGRKRHYRKDGTCKHTDAVIAGVREISKKLIHVDPWGGRSNRASSSSTASPK